MRSTENVEKFENFYWDFIRQQKPELNVQSDSISAKVIRFIYFFSLDFHFAKCLFKPLFNLIILYANFHHLAKLNSLLH